MKTIKIDSWEEIPDNFTGVAECLNGSKEYYKEGELHRLNGPACEYSGGNKYWYIENYYYSPYNLHSLIKTSIYLGKKENGNYNLDWLRFLTHQGIEEFPIIPGMETYGEFPLLFNQLFEAPIK
jgi:hypothetical protein